MEDFKKAVEIDPENSDIYHHRGQVHLLTEQIDNASDDFKKAVDLNPEFPVAYVQKLYTDYRKATQKNDQVSHLHTVLAPIKAADTIQKLFLEPRGYHTKNA